MNKIFNIFFALTIILHLIVTIIYGKCPSSEILYPCVCADDNISCGGDNYYDVKLIFRLVSQSLSETEKHFKQFYFNNTVIKEMVINVFYDITFENIFIENAHNLTVINTHAFIATNFYVKEFRLFDTPYGNITADNNIFNALNSMLNIEVIDLRPTAMTEIPSNAFTVLNKLKVLWIHWSVALKTLGNNAFYDLNNLNQLAIDNTQIEHIPDNAFNIPNKGNQTMILHLTYMPLTDNSFSSLTFATIKYPYEIRLGGNKFGLKYLDRSIFGPVLSNGNTINFFGNVQMECDCRMHWIYENKAQYEKLVLNSNCTSTGNSLFSDREKFLNCIHE